MTDATKAPLFREVSIEEAYEMAEKLEAKTEEIRDSMRVISGRHPKEGSIHIVIPPLGCSIILPNSPNAGLDQSPVVVRDFTL